MEKRQKESKKERRKERKKERKKEGKKERRKEGRKKERKKEIESGFPQLQDSIFSIGGDEIVVRVMTHPDDVLFVNRQRPFELACNG